MTRQHPLLFALRSLLLVALCSLPFATARAQGSTATLSGTVEDQNGAAVPGVEITVMNPATALERQVTTNDEGYYTVPLLQPGKYVVSARRDGFAPAEIRDVVLNVGDQKSLKIALKAGDVKAEVQVTSEAPLINESAAVGTVVDRQFVANIPLNGRSFQSLITLTPGVVLSAGGNNTSGQFSVNGQRANANSYTVDGVSANFGTTSSSLNSAQTSGNLPGLTAQGTTQSLVSLDAMEEFKIQTSTYSAEYGRQPGGQVSIVTRSGTNSFHGTIFDYLRNDVFDANDWFANANRRARPPERQNDFGGTFSGPVFLPRFGEGGPGWYNGKNRTFFFFSYEGLRLRLPQFTMTNVPTLALRQQAPAGLQPLINAFPLPNGQDLGNGLAEFSASYSNPSTLDATSIRVDHSISQKWSLFGRYNWVPSESIRRSGASLSTLSHNKLTTRTVTLGVIAALTPKTSNDLRFNFSDNKGSAGTRMDRSFGTAPISIGEVLPSPFNTGASAFNLILIFPGFTAETIPQVVLVNDNLQSQRQLNLVDNFSIGVGSHQLKFGLDYRRLTPFYAANIYRANIFEFSQQDIINNSAPLAMFSASVAAYPVYHNFSAYIQDTWRFSPRLTLSLGLRWDVNPSPGEAKRNNPLAVTQIQDLASMQLAPQGTPLWKTTYNNFGPRLGLSYQLRDQAGRETIIRGGFGVFYDTGNNQASSGHNGYPFLASRIVPALAFPLSAVQAAPPVLPALSNLTPPYRSITVFDPKLLLPYTLQWNVAVEQSLSKSQVLTISYVGAAGRRLLQQRQFNLSAINPSFTTVLLTQNGATSDYNALQAQFQRRLSKGLQALVSYTWSHALDDDSTDTGRIIPVRGNAAFDVRHNFGAAVTYDIPSPKVSGPARAAFRGWSLDSRVHAQSALPVDIIAREEVNPLTNTLSGVRPNVISGVPLYIVDKAFPGGRRINPATFSVPPPGQFGNLGRNVLRAFGAWQVDAALRRRFNLTERLTLELRGEAFNLFNHPNFGTVQTSMTAANFGQATNMRNVQFAATGLNQLYQIGGPRSFQFALRLNF